MFAKSITWHTWWCAFKKLGGHCQRWRGVLCCSSWFVVGQLVASPNLSESCSQVYHLLHIPYSFPESRTAPKTSSGYSYPPQNWQFAPENRPKPKRKLVFQPPFFRGCVSFRGCALWSFPGVKVNQKFHHCLRWNPSGASVICRNRVEVNGWTCNEEQAVVHDVS